MSKLKQSGFTLVEALIYMAIASIILSTIAALLGASLSTRVKNHVTEEVELQGNQIAHAIAAALNSSDGISTPAQGGNGNMLFLNMKSGGTKSFVLSIDTISIIENGGPSVALSSPKVLASGLTFRNLSRNTTAGTVSFEFTLSHINPEGRNEYDYSKTFYGSGTLYGP